MRKSILLTAILLGSITLAKAQIQKGNIMVGANIANLGLNLQKNGNIFSATVNPKVGFFIRDNLALGPEAKLGVTSVEHGQTAWEYGIGAFGRYYLSDEQTQLVKNSRFFFEASAGFAGHNVNKGGGKTNGLGLGFGPGWTYFITENVGLEALLKYDLTVGFGSATTNSRFGLGVGFQIYLPTEKVKSEYRDLRNQ